MVVDMHTFSTLVDVPGEEVVFHEHVAYASLDDFDPLGAAAWQLPVLRQLEGKLGQDPAGEKSTHNTQQAPHTITP